jgi:hypothetical protein
MGDELVPGTLRHRPRTQTRRVGAAIGHETACTQVDAECRTLVYRLLPLSAGNRQREFDDSAHPARFERGITASLSEGKGEVA